MENFLGRNRPGRRDRYQVLKLTYYAIGWAIEMLLIAFLYYYANIEIDILYSSAKSFHYVIDWTGGVRT